jgi:membrane protease YdiL (CAAX protease family)
MAPGGAVSAATDATAYPAGAGARTSPRARVATYVALVLAFSAAVWIPIIRAGTLQLYGGALTFALMWCPATAAVVASLLTGRSLREIGWRWSGRWALLGLVVPIAYALVAYGATWVLGLGAVPNQAFLTRLVSRFGGTPAAAFLKFLGLQASLGLLISCIAGLGEEIGWRGFLVPELSRRMSLARASLVSGAIWSAWHYPVLIFADYNAGTPVAWGLACFTVMVIGISFVFAASRLASGSVWPAAILHGSHNLFIQGLFDPITADTGRTRWVIGEFGAALALVSLGVAALTLAWWRRRAVAGAVRAEEVA